jgi:hypothetical protein
MEHQRHLLCFLLSPFPFFHILQILQQIQSQLISANRQLNMVRAQLQGSENAKRRLELTTKQLLEEEEGDVHFWQGVGKMCVWFGDTLAGCCCAKSDSCFL